MALDLDVRVLINPWPETVPNLYDVVTTVSAHRASSIEESKAAGEYRWARLALVILDPTAPTARSTEDAVLAIICIGKEGIQFAENALAKACEHRDHGIEAGVLAFTQKHRLSDDDNRRGFSAEVAGTIVGASGLISHQDSFEATVLAAEFNFRVTESRMQWEDEHGRGGWFNSDGKPGARYAAIWQNASNSSRG